MVSTRLSSSINNNSAASSSGTASSHTANAVAQFLDISELPMRCTRNTFNSLNSGLHCLFAEPATSGSTHDASSSNHASNKTVPPSAQPPTRSFIDMPHEVFEKIFSFLPLKQVGQMRTISRKMDQVCGQILNSTFQKLQVHMFNRFQSIKAQMPRRESARRNHPLATESDIVETLHMRLCLLQMTFGKHIERKHCCFFAGEVLDEVYRILHYIKTTPKLPKPYKVTDELFDLSSMAMEYFKEKIEPNLPDIGFFNSDFMDLSPYSPCTKDFLDSIGGANGEDKRNEPAIANEGVDNYRPEPVPQSTMVLRKRIIKIKQGMKKYNNQLSMIKQNLRSCKRKTAEQQKQIAEQQRQLAEQQKQTLEYATRLDENDKKNEEMSRKFSTLLQELNKCKTELQYWRSKSPAIAPKCTECGAVNAIVPQEDLKVLTNQGVKFDGLGITVAEDCGVTSNETKHDEKRVDDDKMEFTDVTNNKEAKTTDKGYSSHNKPMSPGSCHTEATNKRGGTSSSKRKTSSTQAPAVIADDVKPETSKKASKRSANAQGIGTTATVPPTNTIALRVKRAKMTM